jgi:hypothetical protein
MQPAYPPPRPARKRKPARMPADRLQSPLRKNGKILDLRRGAVTMIRA